MLTSLSKHCLLTRRPDGLQLEAGERLFECFYQQLAFIIVQFLRVIVQVFAGDGDHLLTGGAGRAAKIALVQRPVGGVYEAETHAAQKSI